MRRRRELLVLFACYCGALMLPLPLGFLSGWLTGTTGQLPLLFMLFGWLLVASVTSHSFADHHDGLCLVAALLLYLAAFSHLAVPMHLAFRGRKRAHDLALGLVTLGFVLLMALAFGAATDSVPV